MAISECIRPIRRVSEQPVAAKVVKVLDTSTTVYPRTRNGDTIRVVITRRELRSSTGLVAHVCHNAGRWSYRIDYPHQSQTRRMTKSQWVAELTRMGYAEHLSEMLGPK